MSKFGQEGPLQNGFHVLELFPPQYKISHLPKKVLCGYKKKDEEDLYRELQNDLNIFNK